MTTQTTLLEELRNPTCGFRGDDDAVSAAFAAAAADEIERLRSALDSIANYTHPDTRGSMPDIAREAL